MFSQKLLHTHEQITAAELIAVAFLQRLHTMPHFSRWWRLLKLNRFPQFLEFVAVDSAPLPVLTFKRAPRCKFRGACLKLHV